MAVRAKFRCTGIRREARQLQNAQGAWHWGEAHFVDFEQVMPDGQDGRGEPGTIAGEMIAFRQISVELPDQPTAEQFDLNGVFNVDFTPAT